MLWEIQKCLGGAYMFGYCFKMSIYYSEYLPSGRPDYVILLCALCNPYTRPNC